MKKVAVLGAFVAASVIGGIAHASAEIDKVVVTIADDVNGSDTADKVTELMKANL